MLIGFALQKERIGYKEEQSILQYCIINNIPYKFCKTKSDAPLDFIPIGSVEWCEEFLPKNNTIPDYYPKFLSSYLCRKVWRTNEWPKNRVFIKPADHFKKFTGFISEGEIKGCDGEFWCSDVVNFLNEWRYYISNGKILAAEWYNGIDDEVEAPLIDIKFSSNYCAAIDFGMLDTGQIALVEAHLPYACGWYGKNYKIYAEWVVSGWNYLHNVEK